MLGTAAVYQSKLEKTEATIAAGAREVFSTHRSWRFCHRKTDNHPFFMLEGTPSKRAGEVVIPTYYVDLHDCTCDSHRKGGWACKHMRAVRLWFEAVKAGRIQIPRRMTAGDRVVLEHDAAENEASDVAAAADVLLDSYHAEQARKRAARFEEPEQPWWLTTDGGIVWLKDGDKIGLDTGELREVGTGAGTEPTCQQSGCDEPCVPHEAWCGKHVLVDAF